MSKYIVEPEPKEPKLKYVELTDPAEAAAAKDCQDMRKPILMDGPDGRVYAEQFSLRQFRGEEVEIEV
jgi:hypothetical protein